jgi:hypothetical protein
MPTSTNGIWQVALQVECLLCCTEGDCSGAVKCARPFETLIFEGWIMELKRKRLLILTVAILLAVGGGLGIVTAAGPTTRTRSRVTLS